MPSTMTLDPKETMLMSFIKDIPFKVSTGSACAYVYSQASTYTHSGFSCKFEAAWEVGNLCIHISIKTVRYLLTIPHLYTQVSF